MLNHLNYCNIAPESPYASNVVSNILLIDELCICAM